VLLVVGALAACAERPAPQRSGTPGEPSGFIELQPMPEPPGPSLSVPEALPDDLLESLEYPPVTMDVLTALDRVRAAAGDSPDFGDPEISRDRTRVLVRWYGDVPDEVQAVVDSYAEGPVTMEVAQTRFRAGDLRAEAERLIREHPGVVAGVGARPAGDGIDVLITDEAVEEAGGLDDALDENGVVSDFPLFAESGSTVPA